MIKYITSLIKKREAKQEKIKRKFEIVSEYPDVTIKMQRGFFFLLVRCIIVGQAEVRRNADTRTKLSKNNLEWMWAMHREATRMQDESRMNSCK